MSESPFTDLGRPPLRAASLARGLVRPGGLWREVSVVAETGSTNADLAAAARTGAAEGAVLVAESQTAGRGRLDRAWVSPPRAGLTFSVLLRPEVPAARRVWLPLLTGVAVAETVRAMSQTALAEPVEARLKWPNDVVVGGRKLAGILAEGVAGGGIVVGVGLNVTTTAAELPAPADSPAPAGPSVPAEPPVPAGLAATSLAIEAADCTDRDPLLRALLRSLEERYREWTAAGGDPDRCGLRGAYVRLCATLGREVRVGLPGGETLTGVAGDVDAGGRLVVGDRAVSAGDVVHVR